MAEPAPPRPRRERSSFFLFRALAPRVPRTPSPEPPERLRPYETVSIERPGRLGRGSLGSLAGTWFPAHPSASARGAVLLVHPWIEWGRAYFHRRGRIEALRRAGYHALTVDLPGFGDSGAPCGFYDRDVADALAGLAQRAPGVPLHVWGVSSGGYWLHPVLARWNRSGGSGRPPVLGAMFEEVSAHLLEWSRRTAPRGRPFYLLFRTVFPATYRFLDLRRHAPHLGVRSVSYVSGERDRGVIPEDTRELARRAGGRALIVSKAGHLEGIKRARDSILSLALETFAEAEAAPGAAAPPGSRSEAQADPGRRRE